MAVRLGLSAALTAAMLAAASAPASASVTVFGSSAARFCYEAAKSDRIPRPGDVDRCDSALRDEPLTAEDRVATHVNRGILRLRRDDIDGAIADFDQAMALDPDQPEAYLNKGAALMRREQAAEAVHLFTVALERNTRRPAIAHYGRAVAHEALGRLREAYLDYRRASQLDPDWNDPRVELRRFRVVSQ